MYAYIHTYTTSHLTAARAAGAAFVTSHIYIYIACKFLHIYSINVFVYVEYMYVDVFSIYVQCFIENVYVHMYSCNHTRKFNGDEGC